MQVARIGFVLVAGLVVLAACTTSPVEVPVFVSQADAEAIADVLFADAQGSGLADLGTRTQGPPPAVPVDTGLDTLASCTPQKLTPVRACAFGGNIYTTIDQSCPTGNEAQCCAGNPPSCTEWKAPFSGQYKTLYNSCKVGANVVAEGTLNGTLTGSVQGGCSGTVFAFAKIVVNGSFTVRVDGRDACPDGVSLTTQISATDRVTIVMSGSICGRPIQRMFKSGCFVDCGGDKCCPHATYCGRCGNCLPSAYPVDCCQGGCPAGSTCNGSQCKL
jgi:hypothetical protein